ncbi:DUF2254 domain-containing protein [Elioraea rosea]|uniref:DUF2254 domain-containing protein n=1 Tax=Elioraea rosea TaxID=2492390 RepID=UPI00118713C7|nr:DUF2254 domain-containing protein [Elioraea rosea]
MPRWVLPLVYTLSAVVAGLVVPRMEAALIPPLGLGVSSAAALTMLSAIASGMMALTAIVFSIAFVLVQFSAVTYSPRIALRFANDRLLFHAMGMFAATFSYSLAAMAWVDRAERSNVPELSCLLSVALLVASLVVFTRLVQRLSDLQITNTLHEIGNTGRAAIEGMFADDSLPAGVRPAPPETALPPAGAPVQALHYVGPPATVQRLDIAALVGLAEAADGCIVMACSVGDTLNEGEPILFLHGAAGPIAEARLRKAVCLGRERTVEQDPKYPIRLLVDIAIKALSPAINDPTTAVQAIDQVEDLLRRLARHDPEIGRFAGSSGAARLVILMPTWDDYLSLALDEIRMFGAGSIQVLRRLRHTLMGLARMLGSDDPRAASVALYLRHLDGFIERSPLDAMDKRTAGREDSQGLGLTREPRRG